MWPLLVGARSEWEQLTGHPGHGHHCGGASLLVALALNALFLTPPFQNKYPRKEEGRMQSKRKSRDPEASGLGQAELCSSKIHR